ncbi:MAG: signal peptidase I [Planctomycetota bacterium]|nr:signal peptidase I [Planctomycetota bacterium]MDA1179404.1 signal peptidase I [Planctomycetota bacterium]
MAEIRRHPWLAAVLSLFVGPIGQVYGGAAARAVRLWLIGTVLTVTAFVGAVLLPASRLPCLLLLAFGIGIPIFFATDAFCTVRQRRTMEQKSYQRWWVYCISVVLFASGYLTMALFVRSFIAEAFVVPSRGMRDTLQPGDKVLVDKTYYNFHSVTRGDVAVFFTDGKGSPTWVQRVVAIPGDRIEIREETVYLNGEQLDEPYARFRGPRPPNAEFIRLEEMTVPEGQVFMLGDDRRMSKDSRIIGPIDLENLIGRPKFIYWSVERHFPDPTTIEYYTVGETRWDRIGIPVQR